jgi:hypothetical protein
MATTPVNIERLVAGMERINIMRVQIGNILRLCQQNFRLAAQERAKEDFHCLDCDQLHDLDPIFFASQPHGRLAFRAAHVPSRKTETFRLDYEDPKLPYIEVPLVIYSPRAGDDGKAAIIAEGIPTAYVVSCYLLMKDFLEEILRRYPSPLSAQLQRFYEATTV